MITENTQIDTPVAAFRDAMFAVGIEYHGKIIADGTLHRIKANGDKTTNSWYILHVDGLPAGEFGCWKRGIRETWCAKSDDVLTDEERAERDRRWQQQQEIREAERRRQHDAASIEAQKILDAAQPATDDHPYLKRKQVRAYPGIMVGAWPQRRANDCLLIPLRTAAGKLASVQAIFSEKRGDRDKDFLKGGAKTGAFFVLGDPAHADVIYIAEGLATAASVLDAADGEESWCAIMACDAGNMRPVAEAVHALYPGKRIVIAADNDRATQGNPGLTKAAAAAKAIKADLAVPEFAEGEAGSDFNDLAALRGVEAVRDALLKAKPAQTPRAGKARKSVDPGSDAIAAYRGTDEANAALFLKEHGDNVRYCPPWDKWLVWTNSHWRIDDSIKVRQMSADLPRVLYGKACDEIDSKTRDTIAALAHDLESGKRQSALLDMAKCRVVVHNSELDHGRFLLNAANGTIDLSTGKLRNHSRADLLTHCAAIQYDPAATCPTWTRFLEDIFSGDAELIEFVRRAIGYSLTGDVREQILLICHGSGSNGKSVFLNILRKLLGRLALQAAPDLLMTDHNRRHPTEQADLYGRRVVICQETEENRRFNEVLVKQLTGGDSVRARRMREDFWEFEPTWKIWQSTNHRPEIRGTDHAIWRRVRLIPFNTTFHDPGKGDPVKDPRMEEKLTAELPGILAWAVQGCLAWQKDGLTLPDAVQEATEAYRQQQDILAAWLGECCVIKRLADAKAADLYASYSAWCEANGERPEPQRRFGMRLTERGFQRQKRMVGHFWLGVGLLETGAHDRYDPNDPDLAINASSRATQTESNGKSSTSTNKAPDIARANPQPPAADPLATRVAELIAQGWAPPNAQARARSEAMHRAKPGARQ